MMMMMMWLCVVSNVECPEFKVKAYHRQAVMSYQTGMGSADGITGNGCTESCLKQLERVFDHAHAGILVRTALLWLKWPSSAVLSVRCHVGCLLFSCAASAHL